MEISFAYQRVPSIQSTMEQHKHYVLIVTQWQNDQKEKIKSEIHNDRKTKKEAKRYVFAKICATKILSTITSRVYPSTDDML